MLTAIYCIVSIWVFFKLMKVLVKATWGLTKCVIGLIFWPIVIGMAPGFYDASANMTFEIF